MKRTRREVLGAGTALLTGAVAILAALIKGMADDRRAKEAQEAAATSG